MNFFQTIAAVCSGTSCFPAFLERSPWRAFFHFALLAALCAAAVLALRAIPAFNDASRVLSSLSDSLGSIRFAENGILPEKPQASHQAFIISPSFRLDYFPADAPDLSGMDSWKSPRGWVWTPKMLLSWQRNSASSYSLSFPFFLLPFLTNELPLGGNALSYDKASLDAYAKSVAALPPAKNGNSLLDTFSKHYPTGLLAFSDLALPIASGILFSLFIVQAGYVLLCLILIFLFAFVQSMTLAGFSPKLTYKSLLSVCFYAAFPGLIIASAVPALDLPLPSFQFAFFASFLIYHFFAIRTVQRFLAPPKQGKQSPEDDEDGF